MGDLLSSGLGVQGMIWATSPACTEVETRVLDWVAQMLGLPEKFLSSSAGGGVIQDTASSSTLCSLLAARERATGFAVNTRGGTGRLVAYASSQGHSSMEKAVMVAGIGRENLRVIDVDEAFAMRPDLLEKQIQADLAAGLTPFYVGATVGTTSSNAMDPLPAIGAICREYGLWLHVDAAMSGTAALCPEYRYLQEGVELADSYCFNPHKWMFTNFDCDCFFVADRKVLIETLSILPEYLRNRATESGAVIDYRDWHVQLGRRFRALKLWFVIRHYGVQGLQHHVREHVALAQEFASWVEADADFELAAPVPLNLVCFRHRGGDAVNEAIMNAVNASGAMFLTHTKLGDRFTLRMSIGQTGTQRRHVEAAWQPVAGGGGRGGRVEGEGWPGRMRGVGCLGLACGSTRVGSGGNFTGRVDRWLMRWAGENGWRRFLAGARRIGRAWRCGGIGRGTTCAGRRWPRRRSISSGRMTSISLR